MEQRPAGKPSSSEASATPAERTVAAINIGANSVRMVVAEVAPDRPGSRLRFHPLGEERLQPAGLLIQQSDLDDVEVEQGAGVVQHVGLQKLNPLGDRHPEEFLRRRASG